jgi:hypothetical protein
LQGKLFVDLRDARGCDAQYQDLVSTVLDTRPKAPPVGPGIMSSGDPILERVRTIVANGGHGGATHDELRVLWSLHAAGAGMTHERLHASLFSDGSASTTRVLQALRTLVANNLVVGRTRDGNTEYTLAPTTGNALVAARTHPSST